MGTSSSGGGGGGSNPLIPSWIDTGETSPIGPWPPAQTDGGDESEDEGDEQGEQGGDTIGIPSPYTDEMQIPGTPSRFTSPRRQLNKYARSGGTDSSAARKALRQYSRTAAGSTTGMAKRMRPSAARVASFFDAIDTIRTRGVATALADFSLRAFGNRPALEILSAIGDIVFKDTDRLFENTQDDSITKTAFANTITRICEETPDLDLNNLTNEHVEVMMAVFIEETIAQRVINDIGDKFTELTTDVIRLLDIENGIYQIINGLVRTQIMPEISASRRGDRQELERNIENIYRIAFDAMAGTND